MAKRNDPVARARGRKPAPVKKPFPVGFAAGCAALALFLGGIIAYAVKNEGVGDKSSLKYAETQVSGLVSKRDLSQDHKDGVLSYPDSGTTPPVGGAHNLTPESCQVYTAAIANEHAVHSMEHGAAWITYNPSTASKDDVATLKALADGDPYRLMSPYPGLKSKISLQAWGEQVMVDSAKDPRVEEFLKLFTNGPQTKEAGAACSGTTDTGPITAAAPAPVASSTATTAPAPTPSKS